MVSSVVWVWDWMLLDYYVQVVLVLEHTDNSTPQDKDSSVAVAPSHHIRCNYNSASHMLKVLVSLNESISADAGREFELGRQAQCHDQPV